MAPMHSIQAASNVQTSRILVRPRQNQAAEIPPGIYLRAVGDRIGVALSADLPSPASWRGRWDQRSAWR